MILAEGINMNDTCSCPKPQTRQLLEQFRSLMDKQWVACICWSVHCCYYVDSSCNDVAVFGSKAALVFCRWEAL